MNEIDIYNNTPIEKLYNAVTPEQESVVEMFAMELPISNIAKISLISVTKLTAWINGDKQFINAVNEAKLIKEKIIRSKMDQAGLLAADYAIKILSERVDTNDIEGRRNQSNIAKTMLQLNQSKNVSIKVEPPHERIINIDDKSKLIVDKFSGKISESYVVLDDVKITGNEAILFPGTEYGKINIENNKFQCHLCGQWHYDLVVHIRKYHDMSAVRYRTLYELPEDTVFYPQEPILIEELNNE